MKVKLLKAFETPTHRVAPQSVGMIVNVDPVVGSAWCQAGYAEATTADAGAAPPPPPVAEPAPVEEPAATEAAPVETPEATAAPVTTAETKGLDRLTKVELLEMCQKRGISASESDTKKELISKLSGK